MMGVYRFLVTALDTDLSQGHSALVEASQPARGKTKNAWNMFLYPKYTFTIALICPVAPFLVPLQAQAMCALDSKFPSVQRTRDSGRRVLVGEAGSCTGASGGSCRAVTPPYICGS